MEVSANDKRSGKFHTFEWIKDVIPTKKLKLNVKRHSNYILTRNAT